MADAAVPAATEAPPSAAEAQPPELDAFGSGCACLAWLAQQQGLELSERELRERPPAQADAAWLRTLAQAQGLNATLRSGAAADRAERLRALEGRYPLIARLANGNYVVLMGRQQRDGQASLIVRDPLARPIGVLLQVPEAQFAALWSGELLLLRRPFGWSDEAQPFGLRWFIPQVLRERRNFRDLIAAALMLHLLALAVPLFLQLTIDRVVTHESRSTLLVLTVGVCIALAFDAGFQYLRQVLLLDATSRIDLRLLRQTFARLLALPITFFEAGSAGVIARNMQQAEKIRQFLTGKLFMTLLDASVLVVFLPILFFYSVSMAAMVLGFALLIGGVVAVLVPPFRRRLRALYRVEGERQALLVETIQGMRTVKALAVEPLRQNSWEERSEQAVEMHFRVGKLSAGAHSVVSLLEKLMQVAVIALGASLVIERQLSVGALIAFQMLSGRVVSPLVAIISLVHEYQETALSVRLLGEIMNTPPEGTRAGRGLTPALQGRIEFDAVSFRYAQGAQPALDQITFGIPPGKVVGVVGRSGSGKTTLTRILQGMYPVQEGLVRLDGVDLREIAIAHLRRSIGVVLQDSFLFRGTVRENIAISRPEAGFDEVVEAARMSGADEFIERLPQGYDTLLEEGASNLSGGQRQRLAIARALLPQPRILVLDEAASALDPESEAIFMENLARIAHGRTVLIVSHRLSTLTGADAIMVMQRGRIIDAGKHSELLPRCALYARLWQQQTRHL